MINHSWTHECNDWPLQTIAVIPQKKQTPWIACPPGRSSKRAGVLPLSWFCLPIHKKRHGLLKSKSYLQSQVAGNLWNFLFFFFFLLSYSFQEESILEAGRTDGFKDRKSSCQMLLNIQKKKTKWIFGQPNTFGKSRQKVCRSSLFHFWNSSIHLKYMA